MQAVDTSPFLFEAPGETAVLLVHGFTGSPYEMRGLGTALSQAGMTAMGIRLPGHQSPESMTCIRRDAWRAEVRDAFVTLRKKYRYVGVAGLSMGGLLTLDLAATPGVQIDAIASLAAPMFLYGFKARFLLPVLAATPLGTRMKWVKTQPGNIKDDAARARHPSIRWCTIDAVDELRKLLLEVRAKLAAVQAPILIEHATHDTTALVKSADILYRSVGSTHKEKIILPDSYHVITVDTEKHLVERDVVRFMKAQLRGPHEKANVAG
jgi:carboxylesterase